MKQVLIKAGEAVVEEVPAPQAGSRNILVAVESSCISSGTEVSGLVNSGVPLYQRALKQPENVALALKMMQEQGVSRTVRQIRGVLNSGAVTGYSAAGRVIEVGSEVEGFSPGDKVACAGAGIANHAEIIDVPVNLAVRIPDGLDFADAATVTLGSIALQGIRRAAPTLGETVVVMGLGILGQLAAQMLRINGCIVVGVDPNAARLKLARENGLHYGLNPHSEDCTTAVQTITDGFGADAVLITASGSSSDIVSEAMKMCRKKGRVVLVGDVGLNLKREDFYQKELDFFISTSYGPGRYDPWYELQGNDYPIGYVRWTENRNMRAYLAALARKEISLANLKGRSVPIDDVGTVYAGLKNGELEGLVHLISYPEREGKLKRKLEFQSPAADADRIAVGLVGAGGFAQGTLLPILLKQRERYALRTVMSRQGAAAAAAARQFEAPLAATDFAEVLNDPEVKLVLIATRHHLHARQVLEALSAGKHVFVEKPLAMSAGELEEIKGFFAGNANPPLLMTGFNRRFSPPMQAVREALAGRRSPLMVSYRMNAGYLPPEHWVHGEEGGGRNIGEACHIYDLFQWLTGSEAVSVEAAAIRTDSAQWRRNDNFSATLTFADGSICNLVYTALGDSAHPKERMEIYFDRKVLSMTDYRTVELSGRKSPLWSGRLQQKGHAEEFEALASALLEGKPWPISLAEQMAAMDTAFAVEEKIRRPAEGDRPQLLE